MAGLYAADLAAMRAKVRDWADTSVVTDSVIDDFINISIGRCSDVLRLRELEVTVTIPVTASGAAIPSDYVSAKSIKATTNGLDVYLERKPLDFIEQYATRDTGNTPMYFGRKGGFFKLAPGPAEVDEVELIYFQEPVTLVADADTDVFITGNTTAVLYGALVELGVYVSDEEFEASYERKFLTELTIAQGVEDKAEWSGDTLSVTI